MLELVDNVYDGVNPTSIAFDNIKPLLEKVEDRIQSCDCQLACGCVRCIADPMREATTNKEDSLCIVRALIDLLETENPTTKHFARPDASIGSSSTEQVLQRATCMPIRWQRKMLAEMKATVHFNLSGHRARRMETIALLCEPLGTRWFHSDLKPENYIDALTSA